MQSLLSTSILVGCVLLQDGGVPKTPQPPQAKSAAPAKRSPEQIVEKVQKFCDEVNAKLHAEERELSDAEVNALVALSTKAADELHGQAEEFDVLVLALNLLMLSDSAPAADGWTSTFMRICTNLVDDERMEALVASLQTPDACLSSAVKLMSELAKTTKDPLLPIAIEFWPLHRLTLKDEGGEALTDDEIKMFKAKVPDFVSQHGDLSVPGVGSTYKQVLDDSLFVLDHQRVGGMADEIEGIDVDRTRFKLSDYRGKVVLLEFWDFG